MTPFFYLFYPHPNTSMSPNPYFPPPPPHLPLDKHSHTCYRADQLGTHDNSENGENQPTVASLIFYTVLKKCIVYTRRLLWYGKSCLLVGIHSVISYPKMYTILVTSQDSATEPDVFMNSVPCGILQWSFHTRLLTASGERSWWPLRLEMGSNLDIICLH